MEVVKGEEITSAGVALLVVGIVSSIVWLLPIPLWFRLREKSPLSARPFALQLVRNAAGLMWSLILVLYGLLGDRFGCSNLIISIFVFALPTLVYGGLVRTLRYVYVYYFIKNRLFDDEKIQNTNRGFLDRFVIQPFFAFGHHFLRTEDGLLQALLLCLVVDNTLCVLPLFIYWWVVGEGSFTELFCAGWVTHLLFWLPVATLLIVNPPVMYALRKAHDGHFLLRETRLANLLIPPGIICYSITLVVTGSLQWALIPPALGIIEIGFVIVWLPVIICIKREKKDKMQLSRTLSLTEVKSADEERQDDGTLQPFHRYRNISTLISVPGAIDSVDNYLLHFQEEDLSGYWAFWKDINAFKEIANPDYRPGKAYLMYQKYLSEDPLILLADISAQHKEDIYQLVVKGIEQIEEKPDTPLLRIPVDIFEGVQREVEGYLARTLFPTYFKSDLYKEFREEANKKTIVLSVVD